jgi:hypothetical protein
MKLMNEIPSDAAGVIEKIYVENGHPVEYGHKLFGSLVDLLLERASPLFQLKLMVLMLASILLNELASMPISSREAMLTE